MASRREQIIASITNRPDGTSGQFQAEAKAEEDYERRIRNEEEFAFWVRRKDNLNRGLELFRQLDDERSVNYDNWKEICEALCAIEQAMNLGNQQIIEEKKKKEKAAKETGKAAGKKESLYDAWKKWTMDNTNIIQIKLTQDEVENLTKGTLSLCEHNEETGEYILPSLKYTQPKSTSAATTRTLTKDQRVLNAVFLKRCRMQWREGHQAVREKLAKYVVDGETRLRERHAAALRKKGLRPEDDLYGEGPKINRTELEERGLAQLGVARLLGWLEEDEDEAKRRAESKQQDREDEAKMAHAGFLRKKDATRVRLPPSKGEKFVYAQAKRVGGQPKPPRLDFGQGRRPAVRPRPRTVPHNTVQMLQDANLKYVHALGAGQQGRAGDLEFCREELLNQGHVLKENFEDSADFRQEVRKNAKLNEVKTVMQRRAESSEKSYQDWLAAKGATKRAQEALDALAPPVADASLADPEEQRRYWLEVGRALKAVDRRMRSRFLEWSQGYAPAAVCKAAWDRFPPVACDVHSLAASAMRDTFLKLLRPGLDFRAAFQHTLDRKVKRLEAETDDFVDEGKKEEMRQNMALDRREMRRFLLELGLLLNPEQVRQLVDAFDLNRDGRISMKEFLEFTGDWRLDMAGDRRQQLGRRCLWETTCQLTGMPNAYTVSRLSREPRSVPAEAVVTLPSGERRLRLAVPEHERRKAALRRLGLLPKQIAYLRPKKEKPPKEEGSDDGYSDDEQSDGDPELDVVDEATNPYKDADTARLFRMPCEASRWGAREAKAGLQVLLDRSREEREARELRRLLRDGKPPPAPALRAAPLGSPDVGWDDAILCTELLLTWDAMPAGALVAFYSLEMAPGAGAAGKRASAEGRWEEVCRDPPDANGEAQYQHWVTGLKPNAEYRFRLRAFNGFGPGPYTQGIFITRPSKPQTPAAIRIAPTTLTLRWDFGQVWQARMGELRGLFEELDPDGVGAVPRARLVKGLRHPARAALLAFLRTSTVAAAAATGGGGGGHGGGGGAAPSLLDLVAAGEGAVSWRELAGHFQAQGAVSVDVRQSGASAAHQRSVSTSGSLRGSRAAAAAVARSGAKFVLEMCTSQRGREYKKVWEGAATEATLKGLPPGAPHRLRVHAVNREGLAGPPSDSVVATTALETPGAPRLATAPAAAAGGGEGAAAGASAVRDRSLRLAWTKLPEHGGGLGDRFPDQRGRAGGRAKQAADKIMAQWAGAGAEDRGVNLELVFRKYDDGRRGYIEMGHLQSLLEDLGVEPSEERLREAQAELDQRGEDLITYPEFEYWWEHSSISYFLKRSEGISWHNYHDDNGAEGEKEKSGNGGVSILCYRGGDSCAEVSGLAPNTFYDFRLRAANARAGSAQSPVFQAWTAPSPPEAPAVVLAELKAAWLKWYPGPGGAAKYRLESRLVEACDPTAAAAASSRRGAPAAPGRRSGGPYYLHYANDYEMVIEDDEADEEGLPRGTHGGGGKAAAAAAAAAWQPVYEGADIAVKVTGLQAHAVYRFRVTALNPAGHPSAPSEITQLATMGAAEESALLRPGNAAETFTIECTGDVVVGDTILFTERLFVDAGGRLLNNARQPGRKLRTSKLNLSSSQFSVNSDIQEGEFIGERTVAARVLKDSQLSQRTALKATATAASAVTAQRSRAARRRALRLEVIWSTVSRRENDQFKLDKGVIVERSEEQVSQYEAFRVPWDQERRRKGAREELRALAA